MDDLSPRPVPYLTPDLPGTGGILRVQPADFRVEEIPLYPPSGEGDHLLVEVEKIDRTTPEVAAELARALGVPQREVGSAGLKDKRAIARQRLSVPLPRGAAGPRARERAEAFRARTLAARGEGWKVLAADRHGNKLRPGHLAGNRFCIIARGCGPGSLERAQAVLSRLGRICAANLYGPQRFGRRGDNAALGALLLRRAPEARAAQRDRFLRRLVLSALQSELFNRCLSSRIEDGLFDVAIEGDVLRKRASGGLFVCAEPAADTPRVRAGEVDPAGPLPGRSLFAAAGEARRREEAVFAAAGLDLASFAAGGGEAEGARRPYRVPVAQAGVAALGFLPEEAALELRFTLPAGSYAVCVTREVMKAGPAEAEETPSFV